eukprot:1155311-Pelagomonas_calceolata.AAC.6
MMKIGGTQISLLASDHPKNAHGSTLGQILTPKNLYLSKRTAWGKQAATWAWRSSATGQRARSLCTNPGMPRVCCTNLAWKQGARLTSIYIINIQQRFPHLSLRDMPEILSLTNRWEEKKAQKENTQKHPPRKLALYHESLQRTPDNFARASLS